MNEGNITVVDVIATDDGYQLSRPAQDLYIAYEVVRRHIDSDGVRHYAQMSSARITDDGYEFKFETGDVFTCASHEDRPASATVSDAIAGGSSNAIYITVGQTLTDEEFEEVKQTIIDGGHVVCAYATVEDALSLVCYSNLSFVDGNEIWFQFSYVSFEVAGALLYVDYCTLSASGWGSNREFKFALAQYTPAPDPGE